MVVGPNKHCNGIINGYEEWSGITGGVGVDVGVSGVVGCVCGGVGVVGVGGCVCV